MKKILTVLLAALLCATLFTACGNQAAPESSAAPAAINAKADLAGKVVAAQKDSSGLEALQKDEIYSSIKDGAAKEYADYVTAMGDLELGRCDAIVMDSVVAEYYITANQKAMKVLDETMAAEEYGIGFKKGETALKNAVENALYELAQEGKVAEISQKWFGKDDMIVTYAPEGEADTSALPETFVVGLDASFPPMGFTDEKNEIVGADIDLAKAVCEKLGMKFEAKPIDWDAKDMELETGKITCIWNGLTITSERQENYEMSRPYMKNEQVIVVMDAA
ncbi:transporter substrate-binding domain-containing protein [uncultured Anaerotruncus sp.]|uniref:transporter substrate-binding domain-containing protein n=1 Tax=uncultured Anaerotruncus sp. TaxID=905011 RepID=UPI00280A6C97|nr:transporter substrate-binding domain-containing protein [uncultured Anaerotruncus sp.]